MSPRALGWIAIGLAACSSRPPSVRERALALVPGGVQVVAVADGQALASPALGAAIDAAREHVPADLRCVLDVATTSQAIAIGVEVDRGAMMAIVTRSAVARCPALSRISETVWVATVGAGALARSRGSSVLVEPRWERARAYLSREPLAVAAELPAHRVVAVAQPRPLDAWLAIDAFDGAALEREVAAVLARWREPETSELADKLSLHRDGTQVTVHADRLTGEELGVVIADVLAASEPTAAEPAPAFACPPYGGGVVRCHDGTILEVRSLAELLTELAGTPSAPVVSGADVIGVRLLADPARILREGDVIRGLDAHAITDARQLAALARTVSGRAALAVRRGSAEVVLDLSE